MKFSRALLLVFVLVTMFSQAQKDTKPISEYFTLTETDSLYNLAIEKYTEELNLYYLKPLHRGGNSKMIYIQNEDYLFKIPNEVNDYKIIKLGLENRREHFKKNKNRLSLVKISPLSVKGKLLFITITPYSAKLKGKRKLFLSLSHWTKVYFKFDDGKLIFDKTVNGGI